jgi:non-heme chloroperoxidase
VKTIDTTEFKINRRGLFAAAGAAAATLAGGGTAQAHDDRPRGDRSIRKKSVTVSDGTRLSYLEAGEGKTLLMVPGWSQTAEQFKYQLEGLSDKYRVIAVDMRGHGDSDKPAFGYRIQRLAKDLEDVMAALRLRHVNLLSHSMGNSVAWCHLDMFGQGRIAKYLAIDEPTFLVPGATWTAQQVEHWGSIFTDANHASLTVDAVAADLGNPNAPTTTAFLKSMTIGMAPADFDWVKSLNLKMPRDLAALLLQNHCYQDWRDVIPRMTRPTIFVGGKVSNVPYKCVEWQQTQVPGSQLRIFEANEGGSHFMFIQNPTAFNDLVRGFIG